MADRRRSWREKLAPHAAIAVALGLAAGLVLQRVTEGPLWPVPAAPCAARLECTVTALATHPERTFSSTAEDAR